MEMYEKALAASKKVMMHFMTFLEEVRRSFIGEVPFELGLERSNKE